MSAVKGRTVFIKLGPEGSMDQRANMKGATRGDREFATADGSYSFQNGACALIMSDPRYVYGIQALTSAFD